MSFHIGPIRPPSEADSLLLQITNGCTWNKCKFCGLYKHTRFRTYSADDIKKDIDNMRALADIAEKYRRGSDWDIDGLNIELAGMNGEERQCFAMVANWLINGTGSVFLQDGNSLILRDGRLSEVLRYLKAKFPDVTRITSYGRAENLSKMTAEDFAELKDAGLDRIHSGFESGSDEVLKLVGKGTTSEQQIAAGRAVKAGGIELSVYFMPGLGGKALSEENAKGMARVVNAVKPDFLRIRTCAVKPGTELYRDMEEGRFILAGDDDKVRELKILVSLCEGGGKIVSDHIINLLPYVEGHMENDKSRMLAIIDEYLAMPEDMRKLYQLGRRLCHIGSPGQMGLLPPQTTARLNKICEETPAEEWDMMINSIIARYI
ncbi:MAG: radical SAM protein [Eubacterium sp.]|nr:radical SAM protein [Eubacterium sp.]